MAQKEYDEGKLDEVERLLGRSYTQAQIAKEMRVSTKTVQRYSAELAKRQRLNKGRITPSVEQRDEMFEKTLDTFAVLQRAILRTERLQEALEAEIGFQGDWEHDPQHGRCEKCHRIPLKSSDPMKWQAAFKGGETINSQLMTLMKALGQLQDNPIFAIAQQDEDALIITEELFKLGHRFGMMDPEVQARFSLQEVLQHIARSIYNRMIERSNRRKMRFPEFIDVVDGNYKLLEGGIESYDRDNPYRVTMSEPGPDLSAVFLPPPAVERQRGVGPDGEVEETGEV